MVYSRDLPKPIPFSRSLGPSFILLGLALGSGELILWPYLVSQYGLGIIWGGLVGITLQYFLNTEVMRYTLARGESVFVGWRHLSPLLTIWFILSSFIPWVLPGIVATSGAIIVHLFPALNVRLVTIILLLVIGLILSLGKTLYRTMTWVQGIIILFTIPFIAYLVGCLATSADWSALLQGLAGRGDGWWFFPPAVAIGSFFGAFAYSGAGGNLNLAQSYYIKEKGMGMGKYGGKISSLFTGGSKPMLLEGNIFIATSRNLHRWQAWWHLVLLEHGLIFWGLGFLTIALLATLSFATTRGAASGSGLSFLYQQAEIIGASLHPLFGKLFLLFGAIMLFSTQLGIFESTSRIISENIILLSHKNKDLANPSIGFYISLWSFIVLGIIYTLTGSHEPRLLVTLGALGNAAAMMVAFPLIYLLNLKTLPKEIRPSRLRGVIFFLATIFFAVFLTMSIQAAQKGEL